MSKFPVGIVVLGVSCLFLAAEPSSTAQARGLHIRMGGGPIGIVRSIASLPFRGLHSRRGERVRMANVRDEATGALSRADVTRAADWITKPVARVQVGAAAALAGWHGRRGASGWWQHGDGGYGWVGPLFWPFAYYDIYDYTLWGDGIGFWGYGYRDIYAAIFTPYGYEDLTRYMASPRSRRFGRLPSLAQICGDDASEFASLPIKQIGQAIPLSDEQRAALDDLANASVKAAQIIRVACPAEVALTPSGRLAAMQQRLEAMKSAISSVTTPFETFYELLDDDQKRKLTELSGQRAPFAPKVPATQGCAPPEVLPWPGSEIEARLHLNDSQREGLDTLQRMSALARNTLNFNCQPDDNLDPPDRLVTADTRLDAMLDAIKLLRPALDDFLAALSDEQKAQFETIGAKRTS
jgi:hypothetical protein